MMAGRPSRTPGKYPGPTRTSLHCLVQCVLQLKKPTRAAATMLLKCILNLAYAWSTMVHIARPICIYMYPGLAAPGGRVRPRLPERRQLGQVRSAERLLALPHPWLPLPATS